MAELEVAVPTPLARTFTYVTDQPVAAGTRVLVPFGRQRVVGVALGPGALPVDPKVALKRVEAVIDESPVYSKTMLEIARWISSYYMHPLGEVLRTMLPAGTSKVALETYELTEAGAARKAAAADPLGKLLASLFVKKKTSLSGPVLKAKLKRLAEGGEALDLKALVKQGLVRLVREKDVRARLADVPVVADDAEKARAKATGAAPEPEAPRALTARQDAAVRAVVEGGLDAEKPGGVFLLHGVTGSGKTEVYLHLIAATLARTGGAGQTLILVPEISLTPQMTRVFERRFPGQVAVVHSAMTDTDRWRELTRIRRGEAIVLIGPRSAVFGPFSSLRLLIVDEEHDASYKQTTGLTYSGRDVAVLRGKLEGAPVVLGSATPSMESWNNARTGRYKLLELPERVTGRPLPEVEVVEAEKSRRRGTRLTEAAFGKDVPPAPPVVESLVLDPRDDMPVDARVVTALRENLAAGHQAIVLVNRRGYAYYLFSLEERQAVQCPQCSISMTLHRRGTELRCHYCDFRTAVAKALAGKDPSAYAAVGYGSQQAEDFLASLLPGARLARLDGDTASDRDVLQSTLAKFRDGELDLLVGTQILAKGHDFPNVTLIVLLEVDQLLGLPDFRAGERTFQLIVQAAGRAGRAGLPGRVIIQTMRSGHPVVEAAIRQDYATFSARELKFRERHAYPPFARLVAFEINGTDPRKVEAFARRVDTWFDQLATASPRLVERVRVLGPATPPIEVIRGRHRRSLILSSAEQEPLRALAAQFLKAFEQLPGDLRLKVDVDPQSLI
jgi:primosomal protein N' (replication factor Y)